MKNLAPGQGQSTWVGKIYRNIPEAASSSIFCLKRIRGLTFDHFFSIIIRGSIDRRMVMASTLDTILEEIAELSLDDQEMVDEIIRKRVVEGKRAEISAQYRMALLERQQGRIKTGSVADLFGGL
jgi:hypothetical protein